MNGMRGDRTDTLRGAGVLTWVGFGLGTAFLATVVLFVAGYALSDPGGWRGFGLTALWVLPMAGLVALALLRPRVAGPTLAVATLLPLGFGAWSLVDVDGVHDWEDSLGPVSLVLLVVVAAGMVALGLSRPSAAGLLLLVATVGPMLLSVIPAGDEREVPLSVQLVTLPLVVTAGLFLAPAPRAGRANGRSTDAHP